MTPRRNQRKKERKDRLSRRARKILSDSEGWKGGDSSGVLPRRPRSKWGNRKRGKGDCRASKTLVG